MSTVLQKLQTRFLLHFVGYLALLLVVLFVTGCTAAQTSSSTELAEIPEIANLENETNEPDVPDVKNWQERFSDDDTEPLLNQPVLTATSHGDNETRVTIKNTGTTTLEYYSSGPKNIQLFQEVLDAGEWEMADWDWCGTGKKLFEIPPNSSVELVVEFWDVGKRERMQASFSEKDSNRSGFVVLATEPEKQLVAEDVTVRAQITGYKHSGFRVKREDGFDVVDVMKLKILSPKTYLDSSLTVLVPIAEGANIDTETRGIGTLTLQRKCEFSINREELKAKANASGRGWFSSISQLWFSEIKNFKMIDGPASK